MKLTKKSIFLSLLLRHQPEKVGLSLDNYGWASVEDLVRLMPISPQDLQTIVATDKKGRYEFSPDQQRIRAVQGHSIKTVDLEYTEKIPPTYLFHGTSYDFLPEIFATGLSKCSRNHVHLSEDIPTATQVAKRRRNPVVLRVYALAMHNRQYVFYQAKNGVWLTEVVPRNYLQELRID